MSRSQRAARDRRTRQLAALDDRLFTSEEIARVRARLGALRDVDLDHASPRMRAVMPWELAARSRPFVRVRALGLEIPTPRTLEQVLALIVSYPPEEAPPAALVALVETPDLGGSDAASVRDRNILVYALRAMGSPDGAQLRLEIDEGAYDPGTGYELKDDPHLCPLDADLSVAARGCVCRGGTVAPRCGGRAADDSEPAAELEPRVGTEVAVRSKPADVANRGQTRPPEPTTESPAGDDRPAPLPISSVGADTGLAVDLAPQAYSEPETNPPPPPRRVSPPQVFNLAHRGLRR